MNKNKLKEYDTSLTTSSTSSTSGGGSGANLTVSAKDLPKVGPSLSKMKGVNVKVVGEEAEAVIEPQDQATIKYLSNVKDDKGKTSQPFNIGDKQYQMVRGITPEKQVVLGVYCFDDLNESGENIIHPVDHFEKTIAKPMRETMEASIAEKKEVKPETKPTEQPKGDNPDSLRLGDYKHFIVDETTGKFKKFQNIQDLAKYPMSDNEKYMGLSEFKKFFHSKVFGGSQKQGLNEVTPTGQETDEDMHAKAKKLMVLISKRIPSVVIDTIKQNKVAQREVIAAFAELIGVPRAGLGNLVTGIKDLAKTSTQQQQQPQTGQAQGDQMPPEQNLAPISENRKVVKTIKIKDIK
jgi:hypothetical protein